MCVFMKLSLGKHKQGSGKKWKNYIRQYRSRFFTEIRPTDFQIGIGSIVNGYGDLKKSFNDSKKVIDYMDMLRYLYGDKNISVADFSKLGFFQIFEKIKNRDELMEYVPESLVKLYWYDKEHDGELIETLQAYLDCDKSANKAAEKLYVNYRTLSGRLKKIKDISGIDFKNSAEMLAVRNGNRFIQNGRNTVIQRETISLWYGFFFFAKTDNYKFFVAKRENIFLFSVLFLQKTSAIL